MKYSDERFGFSVQKLVLQRAGGRPLVFAEAVGWNVRGNWLLYKELIFSPKAPFGHLPWLPNFVLWKDSPRFLQSDGLGGFLERISLNDVSAEIIIKKITQAGSVLSHKINHEFEDAGASTKAEIRHIILGQDSVEDLRAVNKQQITGG